MNCRVLKSDDGYIAQYQQFFVFWGTLNLQFYAHMGMPIIPEKFKTVKAAMKALENRFGPITGPSPKVVVKEFVI